MQHWTYLWDIKRSTKVLLILLFNGVTVSDCWANRKIVSKYQPLDFQFRRMRINWCCGYKKSYVEHFLAFRSRLFRWRALVNLHFNLDVILCFGCFWATIKLSTLHNTYASIFFQKRPRNKNALALQLQDTQRAVISIRSSIKFIMAYKNCSLFMGKWKKNRGFLVIFSWPQNRFRFQI